MWGFTPPHIHLPIRAQSHYPPLLSPPTHKLTPHLHPCLTSRSYMFFQRDQTVPPVTSSLLGGLQPSPGVRYKCCSESRLVFESRLEFESRLVQQQAPHPLEGQDDGIAAAVVAAAAKEALAARHRSAREALAVVSRGATESVRLGE